MSSTRSIIEPVTTSTPILASRARALARCGRWQVVEDVRPALHQVDVEVPGVESHLGRTLREKLAERADHFDAGRSAAAHGEREGLLGGASAVGIPAASFACSRARFWSFCASATDHIVMARSARPGTGGTNGTAPVATIRRQYSTSSQPGYGDDPTRRVDRLDSVEARADRQVLEYRRQPQLAELRTLGSDGDQVELGERLLARARLEQEHLDARVAAGA